MNGDGGVDLNSALHTSGPELVQLPAPLGLPLTVLHVQSAFVTSGLYDHQISLTGYGFITISG